MRLTEPSADEDREMKASAYNPEADPKATPAQLLQNFVERQDETAFAELIELFGPMVFGVCCRVVCDYQAAEDAFQATFLVLARKAASVKPRKKVANWLYGVAYRTALKSKVAIATRRAMEQRLPDGFEPAVAITIDRDELHSVLDEELNRLPERYRIPILLCDLLGTSHKVAAQQLGWPVGTVSVRVARGRDLLARRLVRHGLVPSTTIMPLVLPQYMVQASAPASLIVSTAKAAVLSAGSQAATAELISSCVAPLTEGVLMSMRIAELKIAGAMLSALIAISIGLGMIAYQVQATEQLSTNDVPKTEPPQEVLKSLQGAWTLTQLDQVNIESTDEEKRFLNAGGFKIKIDGNRLTLQDGSKVTLAPDTSKQPKRLDWHSIENGVHKSAPAIYSLEGDKLRICVGRHGDQDPPMSFDVKKAAPGSSPTCWHLTREKAPAQRPAPEKK
jgi:RNA polymerase sigma factor (sigma-70 family)